jgi:TonB family protein
MKPITGILFLLLITLAHTLCAQKIKSIDYPDTTYCKSHDSAVQIVVEKNAQFQQGDLAAFYNHIALNIRYPSEAIKSKIQGKSYIQFVVDWNGQVKDVTVLKSSGYRMLDNEAVRVVKKSPLWIPAKNKDVCVPQQFTIPVEFHSLGIINKQ